MKTKEEEIGMSLFGFLLFLGAKRIGWPPFLDVFEETSKAHIVWMVTEIKDGKVQGDKANRWIGYVQGVLVSGRLTTVELEAERIREILKKGDKQIKAAELDPLTYY